MAVGILSSKLNGTAKYFIAPCILGFILGYIVGMAENNFTLGFIWGTGIALITGLVLIYFAEPFRVTIQTGVLIVSIVTWIVLSFLFLIYYKPDMSAFYQPLTDKKVPYEILEHLHRWSVHAEALRLLYDLLGITGTIFSLLIAMNIKQLRRYTQWLAFAAALSFGIISAFDIGDKANRTRQAWRQLNAAVLRYQSITDVRIEDLINEYQRAENIVGDVKPNPR